MTEKPMMRLRSGPSGAMFLVSDDGTRCFGTVISMSCPQYGETGTVRLEIEVAPGALETGPDLRKPGEVS